jgi:hypothetical protein
MEKLFKTTFFLILMVGVSFGQKDNAKPSQKFNFFSLSSPNRHCFAPPPKQLSEYIREIYQDRSGNLWFGTNSDGICRYNGTSIEFFDKKKGLAGNQVNGISEDKQGNIWFATDGGLSRFDGKKFTSFTKKEGLQNEVFSGNLICLKPKMEVFRNLTKKWFGI